MDLTAVIFAVASPPGRAPRGIIRASGDDALLLLEPHLRLDRIRADAGPDERGEADRGPSVKHSDDGWPRGIHRAALDVLPAPLPCLALPFPAPHSYTGQHSIELQLPGNPVLLERVIDALLDSARRRGIDARRAEPGEFTARAFMNGRMSLTEAEGVEAMIAAQSDAALRAARLLSGGRLGETARRLADELAHRLALVEAGIDFTDQDDVVPITPADLHRDLSELRAEILAQLEHAVGAEQLESIPWVVLTGAPNAGKSTLFNALLGHERAVVSAVAGTTRDVLAEPMTIDTDHGPAEVMLIDLAGADVEASVLDQRMQAAARQTVERAELHLECVPVDEPAPMAERSVIVRTKADLREGRPSIEDRSIAVSARTGAGLDDLRARIAEALSDRAVSLAADAVVLRPRHEASLRSAAERLDAALALVEPVVEAHALAEPELIAAALRDALDDLGSLAGDVTPDDVLGRIFASFCIGK